MDLSIILTEPALMRCYVCGRETPPRQRYCDVCRRFVVNQHEPLKRRAALIAAYDKDIDGFRCSYSGAILDLDSYEKPFFLCMDHVLPVKGSVVVVASSLFNMMKAELTPSEFDYAAEELLHHRAGAPFDKRPLKFEFWRRRAPSPPDPGPRLRAFELSQRPVTACNVCGDTPFPGSVYCRRCRRFIFWEGRDIRMHSLAMRAAWRPDLDGFVCAYTGLRLEDGDPASPWYLTFDHRIPGDDSTIVVAAFWINAIKTALSEDELWAVLEEYHRHRFEGKEFDKGVAEFKYWRKSPKTPARRPR